MSIWYSIVVSTINSFLELYVEYIFLDSFLTKRLSKKATLFLYSALGVLFTAVLVLTDIGGLRTIFLFGILFAFAFVFNIRWYNQILLTIVYMAMNMGIENITAILMAIVSSNDMTIVKNSEPLFVFGMLAAKFFSFIVVMFIRIKKHRVFSSKPPRYALILLLIPISTIGIIITQYNYFMYITVSSNVILYSALTFCSLLVVSNIVVFYYIDSVQYNIDNAAAVRAANKLIEHQTIQYKELLDHQDKILKLHHDYKNKLIGIIAAIDEENIEIIKEKLIKEYTDISDLSLECPGNNIIQMILNIRKQEFEAKNIIVEFEHQELHKTVIYPVDIAIIFGNALDNAVEACEQFDKDHKKTISVFAQTKNNTVVLIIKNPVVKPVDTHNLKTTKNAFGHGYGILGIQSIVKKYDGNVEFECNGNIFETYVVLNNKKI